MENIQLSVSDYVALTNQTLEYAFNSVTIVGEVSEFKVNQGKWVNFKLKDAEASVSFFMSVFQMRVPIEDGMKLMVVASPKLSTKGYFSLTVRSYKPVGEGSIKKGFELLKAKLEAEGLFAPARKRALPRAPAYVGVITSTESAAYADFTKIVGERWGGLRIDVAHTQVQGAIAADQIIGALRYFNSLEELPEVLVIIRGGGSAEDLASFNDEPLARAIAESRIPTLVGVGHEIDHTLADMVSDVRASTPTNAAEMLVPDRREIIRAVKQQTASVGHLVVQAIDRQSITMKEQLESSYTRIRQRLDDSFERLAVLRLAASQANPENVLRRGYGLLRGEQKVGEVIEIETHTTFIQAEVKNVRTK